MDRLLLAYVSQISRPVEASQALVSSSRLTIPSLPDGGRCCGQTSKMWSTVCSGAPHSQTEESLRPHFSMDELNRPTPVRRRLRVVHCFRGKSRPGTLCGSRMKLCSLEGGGASQSSFQRVLSQEWIDNRTSLLAPVVHVCHRDSHLLVPSRYIILPAYFTV